MHQVLLKGVDARTKQSASYSGARPDLLPFLSNASRILDVGCNVGALARAIKQENPAARIWGVDINAAALESAKEVMVQTAPIDLDNTAALNKFLGTLMFDLLVAADCLEHTVNPWKITCLLLEHLEPKGSMVLSLPNVGRWETFFHFLCQRFPRCERGIFDSTHLRFFMYRNLREFQNESHEVTVCQRNYRLFESGRLDFVNRFLTRLIRPLPWFREFFVFQWIVRIHRK